MPPLLQLLPLLISLGNFFSLKSVVVDATFWSRLPRRYEAEFPGKSRFVLSLQPVQCEPVDLACDPLGHTRTHHPLFSLLVVVGFVFFAIHTKILPEKIE